MSYIITDTANFSSSDEVGWQFMVRKVLSLYGLEWLRQWLFNYFAVTALNYVVAVVKCLASKRYRVAPQWPQLTLTAGLQRSAHGRFVVSPDLINPSVARMTQMTVPAELSCTESANSSKVSIINVFSLSHCLHHLYFSVVGLIHLFADWNCDAINIALLKRQEPQLPQRNSASAAHQPTPSIPPPATYAYGRIRNPQQTYTSSVPSTKCTLR